MAAIINFMQQTGFYMFGQEGNWKCLIMIAISFVLLYLAIVKGFEPLLLLPIAFGMLCTNLPGADMFHEILFAGGHVHWDLFGGAPITQEFLTEMSEAGVADAVLAPWAVGSTVSLGLLDVLYLGVKLGIYPCLIFMGVGTMTENHGYFSQDCARVEKLINTVAHPNFGALVDVGNFMCADEDPVKSVGIMAPYAKHVHAKDFHWKSGMDVNPGEGWFRTRAMNYIRGAIIGQGEAKVYQSIQILKSKGYDGYVTVEFEGMEDNLKGIRIGRDNLARFING